MDRVSPERKNTIPIQRPRLKRSNAAYGKEFIRRLGLELDTNPPPLTSKEIKQKEEAKE